MPSLLRRALRPLLLAFNSLLLLILLLSLPRARRRRLQPLPALSTPTGYSQDPDVHPSAYADQSQDPLDDYDPSHPDDIWSQYLDEPEVIACSRHHLARCFHLDPARHSHP